MGQIRQPVQLIGIDEGTNVAKEGRHDRSYSHFISDAYLLNNFVQKNSESVLKSIQLHDDGV